MLRPRLAALLLLGLFVPVRADAVLDIENRGPTLAAGAFAMRITNIGAIGNPFSDVGRSFDPSFEYPRGSGIEGLKHGDLWVGARRHDGTYRVSGGPLLEWRPTLAPDDRVREALGGQVGSQPDVDDDGDGRFDEESLNGRDDDGDGEVDEDLSVSAAQKLYAEYVDDRPEALAYGYSGGEPHLALGLDVKQEAMAWTAPGYDRIAGLHFKITNHGTEMLEDVRIGFFADLDASAAGEVGGHINDIVHMVRYATVYNDGVSSVPSVNVQEFGADLPVPYSKSCTGVIAGEYPVIGDGAPGSRLPVFGVVPLSHTVDPIAIIRKNDLVDNRLDPYVTGPTEVSFRTAYFAMDLPPEQGGPPVFDVDRYRAMAGEYPGPPNLIVPHDYAVLVSCGPFAKMPPGTSLEFDVALVCASEPDSAVATMTLAATMQRGRWINRYPDTTATLVGQFAAGKSGFTGHETCYEAPPGINFVMDPHCWQKYPVDADNTPDYSRPMLHGTCMWVDLDCDACTGFGGNETLTHWIDPTRVPPSPAYRAVAQDGSVAVEWDNSPEVALLAPFSGATRAPVSFAGYNVYRLSDWRRRGLLPGPDSFQMIASFARDTLQGQRLLTAVTDTTLDYDMIRYGKKQYPIGRYRFVDHRVNDGFDYIYVVTTVGERFTVVSPTLTTIERFESPVLTNLDSLVTPRAEARANAGGVWVVPNPYRAHAPWERPAVAGDTFGRHVDFLGMPRERSTVRVYTVAGDLVADLPHDGRDGDGQLRWNLISRNGQDVTSGIYYFVVTSPLGSQRGKFVVMR